jgi:CheY-specific phosphatase CheX
VVDLGEQETFGAVVNHLAESTVEMFDSYGIPVVPADRGRTTQLGADEPTVVASIGYAGDKVRGALVLVASAVAIESWLSAMGEQSRGADLCDTLGEFSNMLLGRLKGHLLADGLPILMSTPTTALGHALHLAYPAGLHERLNFDGPNWVLEVLIATTFEDGFVRKTPEQGQAVAEAGEMLLF